jgi:hypothetical protein
MFLHREFLPELRLLPFISLQLLVGFSIHLSAIPIHEDCTSAVNIQFLETVVNLFHMYFHLLLMYMLYLFRLKYIPISSHMLNLNYIMILSLLYRYLHIILGILRLGILLFFSFFYFFNVILFF